MKLFGSYTSPYVRHCRIALLETGISCEFIETDMAASAIKSPTKRVPFLEDEELFLTDSSSILKYIREKAGKTFLATVQELDQFCMINSSLDATTNLFFLQRDGLDLQACDYLKRQAARIESSLKEINQLELPMAAPFNDAHIRLACYLGWGLFRKRISLEGHTNLQNFFAAINIYQPFKDTVPPV